MLKTLQELLENSGTVFTAVVISVFVMMASALWVFILEAIDRSKNGE